MKELNMKTGDLVIYKEETEVGIVGRLEIQGPEYETALVHINGLAISAALSSIRLIQEGDIVLLKEDFPEL